MITVTDVSLKFGQQYALKDLTVTLPETGFTLVTGHSGSGKSSLLYVLSGLRTPTSGSVHLGSGDPQNRTSKKKERVAFIFQHHYLLPYLSAFENALAACTKIGKAQKEETWALFTRLGLTDVAGHRASTLSGGERQRVAVARALLRPAPYLFADEPTAALDRSNAKVVYDLLTEAAEHRCVVLVSHDPDVRAYASKTLELKDGRLLTA